MIIGTRQIVKAIKKGHVKKIVVASNCPDFLVKKVLDADKNINIEKFNNNEKELGTKIGKPFPVAMVGYTNKDSEKK